MIKTFSKFYYGFEVSEENNLIAFDEGSGEIVASINPGRYSLTDGLLAVAEAMTTAGTQAYSVTLDRITRKVTISAVLNFTLPILTSPNSERLVFGDLGFDLIDLSGDNIYTGAGAYGYSYEPQFKLQDYVDPVAYKRSIEPAIKKTADGRVEVVRFGVERFMQANITFCTNKPMDGKIIKNNPSGFENLTAFMDWATSKAPMEFIPDESDPATYITVMLEKTTDDQNGTGYTLKELYDRNLPDFYETGRLTFRVIE